ncbi:glycosyltransferase family 2 protein [Oricola thermophila]|uniref:Glycosyltransferase family 2 protein n=1 Tax=Oricola thermophila TaxID=2742145 RepID=A0A6N1VI02_9HYPH|nr:glycosyltransferase family 2 protein [Oricola thermophila]QKV18779.1 glycosyltransferase family 2 protein [Oricola thermophila]
MLLTIVIPTHNRPERTAAAIASVVSQAVSQPCEIVVVDDASDEPFAWQGRNDGGFEVSVLRHDRNGGPAVARNTGVQAARGRLVGFLDSDDCLLPDTLQARIDRALALDMDRPEGEHRILACGWEEQPVSGPTRRRVPRPGTPDDFLRGCWFSPGSCILANAGFLRRIDGPFDTRMRRLEDYDLFARLGLLGAELVVEPVIGARIHTGTVRSSSAITEAARMIRERFEAMLREGRIDWKQMRAVDAYLAYEAAHMRIHGGRPVSGAFALAASFFHAPRLKLYPGPGWD